MAKPTAKIEIAFSDLPYVTSPAWTDVTSYVRSVSTRRGRASDWDNFGTGTASVVLDNRDRRFDPTYTSGPYYGTLQPRRQIRITADAGSGGGYVAVFRGFIAGWPVEVTDAGYDSTVTLQCFDLLGLLSQEQTPRDWSDTYIRSLNPTRYYRLDENINPSDIPTTSATRLNFTLKDYGSDGVGLYATLAATPTSNTDSFAPGITARTVVWPTVSTYEAPNTIDYTSGSGSIWFQAPETTVAIWDEANGGNRRLTMGYTASTSTIGGSFANQIVPGTFTLALWSIANVRFAPGSTHHVAFTWSGTNYADFTITVLVDGVAQTVTYSYTTATAGQFSRFAFAGANQQIAAWRSQLTTTQLRTIYQYGNNVLTETTAARFTRLLDTTPVPAAWESPTASPAGTVAPLTVGGVPITTELETVATSEGGDLFVTKAGILTLTERNYFGTNTKSITNQATFGSAGNIPIAPQATYELSADDIRNSLEITWAGDTTVTVTDTSSVNSYGTQQATTTTQLSTLADAQNLGDYLVGYGKMPRYTFSDTVVGQALSAAQWATVLNLELLERITVVIDLQTGNDPTQVQLIQAIEHEITPGDWRTTIRGSARWASSFILDSSLLDGDDLLT